MPGDPGLAPVSGAALFRRETERRQRLRRRGALPVGCPEVDDALLLGGGFERGCVVGVSAEGADFGVLLGLQTIARTLVFGSPPNEIFSPAAGGSKQRAAIVTTLPLAAILPTLRDVIRSQVQIKLGSGNPGVDAELRRALEAISISRIFDIEGLWEVLNELAGAEAESGVSSNEHGDDETMPPCAPGGDQGKERETGAEEPIEEALENEDRTEKDVVDMGGRQGAVDITDLRPLRIRPEPRPSLVRRPEVLDSEDEEPLSSSPLSSPPPSTAAPESPSPSSPGQGRASTEQSDAPPSPSPPAVDPEGPSSSSSPPLPPPPPLPRPETSQPAPAPALAASAEPTPDIILVTHFNTLLAALFTTHSNDKTAAHARLQDLATHLRALSRSAAGPLIMLLNTTTTQTAPAEAPHHHYHQHHHQQQQQQQQQTTPPQDATLRSIFASRRAGSRPSFGAVFAQLLDLHLLCARVPRTAGDAETALALGLGLGLGPADDDNNNDDNDDDDDDDVVRYAWIVEALLDEGGAWDWGGGKRGGGEGEGGEGEGSGDVRLPRRVGREQRWAAVEARRRPDGVRVVVDAFGPGPGPGPGVAPAAAGLGSRRV
ncbi:putative protein involved in assembly of cytochrome oxidase [Rosellinia necatrix]|uniref:Uncharacterized protein n=1 Tax=Rosellinia necatrix TaxID=77044 RepID=A0A1W2TWG1_ROSNE|nr:putative protein involved in assembly of cytochrome oxidase [Rosellinia necatrix]